MKALLASSNPHKLEEIQAVIPPETMSIVTLAELEAQRDQAFAEPVEDRDTFEGNAMKKAEEYAAASGWVTIADDSGLAVDALGGAPGVISARYAGVTGPRDLVDPANNVKLLEALDGVPLEQRGAKFVCVMCVVWPEPKEHEPIVVRGEVHGRILLPSEAEDLDRPEAGRGDQGFGYDPLFVLPADHADYPGTTLAELADHQKNALSHRGVATRLLLDELNYRGLLA